MSRSSAQQRQDRRAERVRHLLALDARNVMARLRERQGEMVRLFSRLRDRTPLTATVESWFVSISFGDLAELEPGEQLAVNTFHEHLAQLRWYLLYTEDMPTQVLLRLVQFTRALEASHRTLVEALGPPDGTGAPVVEVALPEDASARTRRRRSPSVRGRRGRRAATGW